MKVKDLEGINPEAEIKVALSGSTLFNGKLTFGWSCGDDNNEDNKATTKEVYLFLGDIN